MPLRKPGAHPPRTTSPFEIARIEGPLLRVEYDILKRARRTLRDRLNVLQEIRDLWQRARTQREFVRDFGTKLAAVEAQLRRLARGPFRPTAENKRIAKRVRERGRA